MTTLHQSDIISQLQKAELFGKKKGGARQYAKRQMSQIHGQANLVQSENVSPAKGLGKRAQMSSSGMDAARANGNRTVTTGFSGEY